MGKANTIKGRAWKNLPPMYAFNVGIDEKSNIFFEKVLTKYKCCDMMKEKGGFHL